MLGLILEEMGGWDRVCETLIFETQIFEISASWGRSKAADPSHTVSPKNIPSA